MITYLEAIRSALARALAGRSTRIPCTDRTSALSGAHSRPPRISPRNFRDGFSTAPLSEDAIVGVAIGAAIEGMRPISRDAIRRFFAVRHEPDSQPCGDLVLSNGGALSDCRCGCHLAGRRAADRFTARAWRRLYAHYPGLIVMTPGTVEDAFSMLLEAVAIDDPVLFCEHKFLYNHFKADRLPDLNIPSFKARLARQGRDATIVTYGAMLHESLAAADELAEDGYEIEIVDLRTVKPLDTDTVLASVARTRTHALRQLRLGRGVAWLPRLSPASPPRVWPARRPAAAAQCEGYSGALSS